MDRRERRRLDAEIELLRNNILLAGERRDLESVRAFQQTIHYLRSLNAEDGNGVLLVRSPSRAVRDVLELIRGPVEVRITSNPKHKKPATASTPPDRSRGPSGAGAPTSPVGMAKPLLRRKGR